MASTRQKPKIMKWIIPLCLIIFLATSLSAQEPESPKFFETGTDVYTLAEEMPRFPGCEELSTKAEKEDCSMRKMLMFLYGEISYPEEARTNKIGGTAVIEFIVEKDGSLSNFNILEDPGAGCGEEALRVIRMMPNFIPGKQHGEPVRVLNKLPVKFSIR